MRSEEREGEERRGDESRRKERREDRMVMRGEKSGR